MSAFARGSRRSRESHRSVGARSPVRRLLFAGLLLVVPAALCAQAPRDSLVASVLTMGPGDEVFERFGHISIRLRDLRTGADTAYNWGMFSFDQPRFLQRFLTGDTRYWMEGFPAVPLIEWYRKSGRWVTEQELELTPAQADSLRRFIQWNALEEHKWYRYDYYRDNCSTRVRDALDMVLGGAFHRAVATHAHGVTHRSETLRLSAAYPALDVAMDFALGRRADSMMSAWEELFIPMRLRELIRDVRLQRDDGTIAPLVRAERALVLDDRYAERPAPPDLFWPLFAAGLGSASMVLLLGRLAARSMPARWALGAAGAAWHFILGSAGLLVLYLGLFTRHTFMAQNSNLLLATPGSLALAVLIPVAIVRPGGRAGRAARALTVLASIGALVALAVHLPMFPVQANGPLLALALPVHVAFALAIRTATIVADGDRRTPPVRAGSFG